MSDATLPTLLTRDGAVLADALLALGLLLSSATQLRIEGSPVGAGELCLALWLGVRLCGELNRPSRLSPAFFQLLVFWLLFAVAQCIGSIMSLLGEAIRDPFSSRHDTIAYLLVAGVSCVAVMQPDAQYRLRRSAWIAVGLGAISFAVLIIDSWGFIEIPLIEPWYYDRLIGWAENANMFALISAILAFLSIYLAETSPIPRERIVALACGSVPIATGLLTKSDAFVLFLIVSSVILIGLKLRTWLTSFQNGVALPALACVIIMTLPLMAASVAPLTPTIAARMESAAAETYDEDGQGEHRFQLWREGISRGIDSGLLGFGPGAHLVKTKFKRAPPPNFEAHNTIIDIFTQGGFLAVLSLALLAVTTFLATYRTRRDALTALLFGLAVFSMFHLIVRHPIFWFVIALCFASQTGPIRKEEHP